MSNRGPTPYRSERRGVSPLAVVAIGTVALGLGGVTGFGVTHWYDSTHPPTTPVAEARVIEARVVCQNPTLDVFGAYVKLVTAAGISGRPVTGSELQTVPGQHDRARITVGVPADTAKFGIEIGCGEIAGSNWQFNDRPWNEDGTEKFMPIAANTSETKVDLECDGSLPLPPKVNRVGNNGTLNGVCNEQPQSNFQPLDITLRIPGSGNVIFNYQPIATEESRRYEYGDAA